jgi:hypothetical protein
MTNIYPPLHIKFNEQEILNVDSYTYLGIKFNDCCDLSLMINDRLKKGIIQFDRYESLLKSNKVSMIAKSWCLKLIILPTLTYGSEIWGMNKCRTNKMEKSYKRSCFRLPKNSNMKILSNDLDLNSVYLRSCKSRMRFYLKAPSLNSYISDVIKAKMAKITGTLDWPTTTKKWISRSNFTSNLKEITGNPNSTIQNSNEFELRKALNKTFKNLQRSISLVTPREKWFFSEEGGYKMKSIIQVMGLERPDLSYGITILMRMRTGSYWTAPRLAHMGMIDEDYKEICPFCLDNVKETISHYIAECRAWNWERKTIFDHWTDFSIDREVIIINEMLTRPLSKFVGDEFDKWLHLSQYLLFA